MFGMTTSKADEKPQAFQEACADDAKQWHAKITEIKNVPS